MPAVTPVAILTAEATVLWPRVIVPNPAAGPINTLVIEFATPFVPMFIALVDDARVAPVPILTIEAAVLWPRVIAPNPAAGPINTLVVEFATPFVPMFISLVDDARVAPLPILIVEAAVLGPRVISLNPFTGPMDTLVVEPVAPPVPILTVLVNGLAVALSAILTVVAVVVEVPKLMFVPLKILFPE